MKIVTSFSMGAILFAALTAPTMLPEYGWRPLVAVAVIASFVIGLWCGAK